jgi:HAMP domain-containing protein
MPQACRRVRRVRRVRRKPPRQPRLLRLLRLLRPTARLRMSILYAGLFLISGAFALAITYLLAAGHSPTTIPGAPGQARLRAQHHADLSHLLHASAVVLAVGTLSSALLGWFAAGRVLRPLRTITAAARTISATNLHERLALPARVREWALLPGDRCTKRVRSSAPGQGIVRQTAKRRRLSTLIRIRAAGSRPTAWLPRQRPPASVARRLPTSLLRRRCKTPSPETWPRRPLSSECPGHTLTWRVGDQAHGPELPRGGGRASRSAVPRRAKQGHR